jgi:hypothetical protein
MSDYDYRPLSRFSDIESSQGYAVVAAVADHVPDNVTMLMRGFSTSRNMVSTGLRIYFATQGDVPQLDALLQGRQRPLFVLFKKGQFLDVYPADNDGYRDLSRFIVMDDQKEKISKLVGR